MKKIIEITFISFLFSFSMYGQSKAATKSAISKALTYIHQQQDSSNFSYNLKEILHYFLRNNITYTQINKNSLFPFQPYYDDDILIYPFYQRLHNKNLNISLDSVNKYIKYNDDINKVMMWALFSDKLEKNKDVNQIIHSYLDSNSNIRQIAHISIALKWTSDLGALSKIDSANDIIEVISKKST